MKGSDLIRETVPIRWHHCLSAGGKRRLVRYILPLVPREFNRFLRAIPWSGAVFLHCAYQSLLSDRNPDLISTYRQVGQSSSGHQRIEETEKYRKELLCNQVRGPQVAPQKAARLIYLSTLSFNGIHRVNLKGAFNVPYGFKTHLIPCEPNRIQAASEILRRTEIECQDFEVAVADAQKGDVVYLDPPYTTAHSNNGS